jgi:hypothetical protein
VKIRGADGLTPFQRSCEGVLSAALSGVGSRLSNRTIETPQGNEWIRATIGDTDLVVWIHDDTVGIDGRGVTRRFEEWDYRTPEDCAAAFTAYVVATIKSTRARAV